MARVPNLKGARTRDVTTCGNRNYQATFSRDEINWDAYRRNDDYHFSNHFSKTTLRYHLYQANESWRRYWSRWTLHVIDSTLTESTGKSSFCRFLSVASGTNHDVTYILYLHWKNILIIFVIFFWESSHTNPTTSTSAPLILTAKWEISALPQIWNLKSWNFDVPYNGGRSSPLYFIQAWENLIRWHFNQRSRWKPYSFVQASR